MVANEFGDRETLPRELLGNHRRRFDMKNLLRMAVITTKMTITKNEELLRLGSAGAVAPGTVPIGAFAIEF